MLGKYPLSKFRKREKQQKHNENKEHLRMLQILLPMKQDI
jgi:hypothetical protein